ncbi:MAG: DNA repair and recombination protein RadA [Candidatus Micrarchaeota archaeon]|nr:DNA repair and recombination protein RadA [Candidatus Micrarchaeota archaeon]
MPDDIESLPGVGPKTAEKLMEAGFDNYMSIAASSAGEIMEATGLGEETANKVILAAREKLNMGFETGMEAMEKRGIIGKITTGSKSLDDLIGGGIETQAITEAYGAFGSGKSQLAHQLAVNVQLPKDEGGLEGKCIFIDTEHTFRPERIKQMAEGAGLDPDSVLQNIFVARAYNSDHQVVLVEKAAEIARKENIRLVVVDSITGAFRAEYTGRGTLANRQQKINRHMSDLKKLADVHNLAIYITNQVMSNPAILFGDPTAPIGGNIIGHGSTFRLYLRKSKDNKRICKLVDSPSLPDGETIFKVTTEGIRD